MAAASLGGQRERGWGCIGASRAVWGIWDSKWGQRGFTWAVWGHMGVWGRVYGVVHGATWAVRGTLETRGTLRVLVAIGGPWDELGVTRVIPKHLGLPEALWGSQGTQGAP